jgi:hypothetical protein
MDFHHFPFILDEFPPTILGRFDITISFIVTKPDEKIGGLVFHKETNRAQSLNWTILHPNFNVAHDLGSFFSKYLKGGFCFLFLSPKSKKPLTGVEGEVSALDIGLRENCSPPTITSASDHMPMSIKAELLQSLVQVLLSGV